MNPYKDVEESSFTAAPHLTYGDIATKLLKDHFFLTALELHTELVENGKELPQLREFFSNPGNFEQHVTRTSEFGSMQRTPSQATLDSLDTARYSEDGGGDRAGSGGDVAVLEFELRKARETINALRANLTQFADGEIALDKNCKSSGNNQRSLKPHEKKALNFLINEYLLLQDYKLTSITFSDENPNQEFEDWDDVGLNMPRPPNLISLFWGNASMNVPKVDASTDTDQRGMDTECQTDTDNVSNCVGCQHSLENETHWNHELLIQTEEIELLKQKIVALETEKLNFQKLYDAAIVSLNSLTSPTSDGKGLDLQIPDEKLLDIRPITLTAMENHYGSSGQSTHSATPEQFEIIDSDKNPANTRKDSSNTDPIHRGSVTTLDDTLSITDAGDWARLHYDYTVVETNSEMWIHSPLPTLLKEAILCWCNEVIATTEPVANDLLTELVNSEKPVTLPGLLILVADTLPRIIPHTLVGRRHELSALLAACISLLPVSDTRRARLLYLLLTLVKKPEMQHTVAICEAASLIVKWGGGGELLSTIAELLGSKSSERRLLASQICVYIAPYITIELCTSLLFSVIMLMCDSSESDIRILGLKAACLICPVAENKYAQLENILFNLLRDSNEKVVKDAVSNYLPILARSALIAGKLATDLCKRIIHNLIKSSSNEEWKSLLLYIDVLKSVVLSKVAYVANVQIVNEFLSSCSEMEVNLDEVPLKSEKKCFIDVQCYLADSVDANSLVLSLNCVIKNDPDVRWPELVWFIDEIKQILQMATSTKVLNHPAIYENLIYLFSSYVNNFGDKFSISILRPIFMEIISELEQKMEKLHSVNVDTTIVVGIYLVTVLPVQKDQQNAEFLQKWIMYSSIRGLPVKMFSIPLKWLSANDSDSLSFYLQHLRELAASSCESSNGASIRVYIASLLNELLNIAEINEQCIMKILLPTVTAFLHDEDVSVRESAFSLWGVLTRYAALHALDAAACWAPLQRVLSAVSATVTVTATLTGKEGARAAEAAALLVMPGVDCAVDEKAIQLICALCHCSTLTSECVAALAPGLQLAVRYCPGYHGLLPALRKLEESVQSPSLSQFKPTIETLLHCVSGSPESQSLQPRPATNLQTAQEVGRRVTQMFQHKTNMNLQNIFKKKT